MTVRRIAVAVFVALVVVGFVAAIGQGFGGLDLPEVPRDPVFEENVVAEAPPLVDPPPDAERRMAFWLRMLTTGDEIDVQWAVAQIRRGGAPARQAVLEAAQRSVTSNPALIQQALEILLLDPQPGDFALARDVLESRDPQGVARAILLLSALGRRAEPVADRLASLAIDREYPVPQYALKALVEIGTPASRDAVLDAVPLMSERQRGIGYMALAEIGDEECRAFLRRAFEVETESGVRLAASEALLAAGDDTVRPWLREELARTPSGAPYHESVLRILAKNADPSVVQQLSSRVSDPLDSAARRARFLALLAPFRLADLEPLLRRTARAGEPVEVRVQAYELLVKNDAAGSWNDLLSLLGAPGDAGADDRRVAALTLGRVRRPDAGPRIIQALASLGGLDSEARSLYLRALLLSGHVPAATVVTEAVARDTTPFGVGGVGFEVMSVLGEITPEVSAAFGTSVVRGLRGEFGEPRASGLQFLLLFAPLVCGDDASSAIDPYLAHERREIREAAVGALAYLGTRDSLLELRRAWRRKQDDMLREQMRDTMIKLQHRAER